MKKKILVILALLLLCITFNTQKVNASDSVSGTVTQSNHFTVTISQGGSYIGTSNFTVSLTLNGKTYSLKANCAQHYDTTPTVGLSVSGKVYYPGDSDYNKGIATVIYYGYWGPGADNYTGSESEERRILSTSWALSYLTGNVSSFELSGDNWDFSDYLHEHYNALDVPDDVAYFLVEPSNSSYQILAGYIEVEQNGDLVVEKKDTYGSYKAGATFHVVGDDVDEYITTGDDGKAYLSDIPVGTYTVTETTAPANMILNSSSMTVEITSGNTKTLTVENSYQRGSVTLTKYDSDNAGNTKGDATLSGAVFKLYAASDIYEGSTKIYSANEVVATVTTDSSGNTTTVSNLPIGEYYYLESSASTGFNLNSNRYSISVTYTGQENQYASSNSVSVPETPIYGTIQITKILSESDYDAQKNLSGVQFKITLNSDSSQVYYTNTSSSDGVCTATNIPYGTYTVTECVTPNSALKIDDFTVTVTENGKTYSYSKTDTSKKMKIAITKEITLESGEATDATVEGAYFTVYTDASCTTPYKDKNGNTVVIGPTDSNGYAESKYMWTGKYYLKETTFPEGIDPDATVTGESVTYRNKVYTVSYDNSKQTTEKVTVSLTVQNKPIRNDIVIYKNIEETSNTDQAPLDKCEFTATLVSTIGTSNVYSVKCTAQTDENGYCIIENLPYGKYVIEETTVSPISLKCANFYIFVEKDRKVKTTPYDPDDAYKWDSTTLNETTSTTKTYSSSYDWTDSSSNLVDVAKVMQIKIRKVDYDGYYGGEAVDYTQGDATLEGAIYEVYRYDPDTDDYTEYVYDITVDHKDSDGYWCAETDDLLVGKYMVVEKVKTTKTGNDGQTYKYSYAEGYLVDETKYYFESEPSSQNCRITYHSAISKEKVIRGSLEIIKYDDDVESSDEAAAQGARLRLTLTSTIGTANEIYYEVEIDEYGYANFIDTNDEMHSTSVSSCYGYQYYPYTIPYGEYTITEVEASDSGKNTSFYIQPETVTITEQTQKEYRIEADEPVPAYLRIYKTDADTSEIVELTGATFKIWSVDNDDWVTFLTQYQEITELHVTEDGYLITPQQLQPGTYIIYETETPEGYYWEDTLRIPEDESKIGNIEYGGVEVVVDKLATGLDLDAVSPEKGYTGDLYIDVEISNRPLKAQLQVYKTGEVLTTTTISGTLYGEKYTPVWEEVGLAGVTYNVVAAEDIMSPDGNYTYVKEGTVVDTITTGEDGYATTKELYLGTYKLVEIETPEGYLIDDDIEEITLTNKNEEDESQTQRVKLHNKDLTDVRQKLELTFKKTFEDVVYSITDNIEQTAVFGVYTNEDIKNYNSSTVIPKDSLVDVITVTGNGSYVTSTIDLPEGSYYVKELETSYPYEVSDEVQYFTLEYTSDNTQEFVVFEGEDVDNTYNTGSITLIKISTSTADDVTLYGSAVDTSELDDKISQIINDISVLTKDEIATYLEENDIKFVAGATYKVYTDEACTKVLKILNESTGEYEEVTFVTDDEGMLTIEGIPTGTYYFKEVSAPKGYTVSDEVVEITITAAEADATVYQALIENSIQGNLITKTDIFTGDVVPDCTFEITDEEGNVLVHSVTDEEGNAYIPVDLFEDGQTYYYTEIDAPEIYELNTDSHEFVAQINEETGEWIAEPIEVENIRKTSTVTLTKLDLMDSTPIPNCKFELRSLETDFVVEGVTDENGIYVFENIPYGEYTYTELEAPEEYQIDTTPHEITIDAEEITIQVTNQLVDTSDIQVVTLSIISISSMLGVVYILKQKLLKI